MTIHSNASGYKVFGGLLFPSQPFAAIVEAPIPAEVCIVLDKSFQLSVEPGQYVQTGQPLCAPHTDIPSFHASVSGTVKDTRDNCVTIVSDGKDEPFKQTTSSPVQDNDFERYCRQMGLVGLGGATYPVDRKLRSIRNSSPQKIDTLLINAAECDPDIYCDEALIHAQAEDIANGIELLWHYSKAKRCVVGIEENKHRAIDLLKHHLPTDVQLVRVPAVYPSGAENTLFALCTGETGGLQKHHSLCFNIATCYSINNAIKFAQPLISRITTISTGSEILNFHLRIGTPIADLVKYSQISDSVEIIHGGRMMGIPVTHNSYIKKSTNSLIFRQPNAQNALPCIRCGNCADVCPEQLQPQHLHWYSKSYNPVALKDLNIDRCIECACCDQVCPSHIKLARQFSQTKQTMRKEKISQEKATLARQRYENRLSRLYKQTSRQRKQLDNKSVILSTSKDSSEVKKDLIAKALQRNKRKKPSSGQTDND